MKRLRTLLFNLLCAVLLGFPAVAWAEDAPEPSGDLAPIIITEAQPGTNSSASEEFIELYNTTTHVIDFATYEWRLEIASTTATTWDSPFRSIALTGSIAPGQTYVVASQFTSSGQTVRYLPQIAQDWFSAGIAATAGHIRLVYSTNRPQSDDTCSPSLTVVDQLEWSAPANGLPSIPSLDGRTVALTPTTGGVTKATTLQRVAVPTPPFMYVDTGNDSFDFVFEASSIGVAQAIPTVGPLLGDNATAVGLPSDTCNPAPPPLDDPPADPSPTAESPEEENGDESELPASEVTANVGLSMPQLSEVLPDPVAPQADAVDEFVELYNPNDTEFDLSGFVLEVGTTTKRTYTFPAGTMLMPRAFKAFFPAETHLSLANTSGQVTLFALTGNIIALTGNYGAAKLGQSWVFANAIWQWTTTPTPNAANTLTTASIVPKVKTAAASTKPKPTAPAKKTPAAKAAAAKTAKPKKPKTEKQPTTQVVSSIATPVTPLHPGILAVAAIFALLYGTYEYRSDLANKFHQFRANRTARREARRIAERR